MNADHPSHGELTRLAVANDLESLIALYLHSNPNTPKPPPQRANDIWTELLARPGIRVFARRSKSALVASCTLITVPNLMRGGRPHAFIENVVTHSSFRRRGHGRAVMMAALEAAWREDCHGVMLLTGREDPAVHQFYQRCGFEPNIKKGYVVRHLENRATR